MSRWLGLATASALLVSGCASDPFRTLAVAANDANVELSDTAFFPQERYQCGPAALATLLNSTGVAAMPDDLVSMVYVPDRHGSLQAEMLAASRRFGRIPYLIDPEFQALLQELQAGRPVLVFQNLGVSFAPTWHYAVVIGYSATDHTIILRSGTTQRRIEKARTFMNTWQRSDYWGLILLKPDSIPETVDAERYLHSVAAAESAGQFDLAKTAYQSAVARWPGNPVPYFGLGNVAAATEHYAAAETAYRHYLAMRPGDLIGTNNLASVLTLRGQCAQSSALIEAAIAHAPSNSPFKSVLEQTASEARSCNPAPD